MNEKRKVIAIANQKGGVGKTTTVANVAANLVKKGYKTLCIDFDAQGDLSDYFGYEDDGIVITELLKAEMSRTLTDDIISGAIVMSKNDNIAYIPSDISLATADMFMATAMCRETVLKKLLAHEAFDEYDYILIDCLPSLGILVLNALVACDGVVIPVQTQKFALKAIIQFEETFNLATELNPKLRYYGVLETMFDKTKITEAVDKVLCDRYGELMFKSRISKRVEASNSTVAQKALEERTTLGAQYAELTAELIERINGK